MTFLKQDMLTITESFVKNIFMLVGFSIFLLYVILTELRWKTILRLIDLIDWLVVFNANFKQYFSYIKPEYPQRTTDHKLVNCITCGCKSSAPFCNLQSLARNHAVVMIGLYELLGNPTTKLKESPGPSYLGRLKRKGKYI